MHDTAIWNEWESTWCCEPGQAALSFDVNFIMLGDTSINSLPYKKIYFQTVSVFSFGICPPGNIDLTLRLTGFIREDSSKKVFYLANLSNPPPVQCSQEIFETEKILYDFALSVGDTVPWKPYDNIVIGIDSIQAPNGEFLRRIAFDNQQDFWIEGFGCAFAFFGSYMGPPFECGCGLDCAQASDLLPQGSPPPCGGIVNAVDETIRDRKLKISPNPFSDFISLISPFQSSSILSVTNSQGQIILKKRLQPFERILLTKNELPVGDFIFFHLISDEGASQSAIAIHVN